MIIFGLLVLLVATRVFAEGAVRLRLPASVGESLRGVALAGGIVLVGDRVPVLGEVAASEQLALVAQAGIFFLVLQAGIEMKPNEVRGGSGRGLLIALGGAMVPFAAGMGLAWAVLPESEMRLVQALVVGVVLSITSIPAAVKVLQDLGLLHTPVGRAVVTAAIFDDIIGLFLIALVTSLLKSGVALSVRELLFLGGEIAVFFTVTMVLGAHVYPRVSARLKGLQLASVEFSTLMVVALGYGLFADLMGLHWIVGVFVAGLFFEPSRVSARAYSEVHLTVTAVTVGFLGPLFFASIGLHVRYETFIIAPGLLGGILAVGFLGKLVGAGGIACAAGFGRRDASMVGVGMSMRGAVELVVLSIAVDYGVFCGTNCGAGAEMVSALILMTVMTTLVATLILRAIKGGA